MSLTEFFSLAKKCPQLDRKTSPEFFPVSPLLYRQWFLPKERETELQSPTTTKIFSKASSGAIVDSMSERLEDRPSNNPGDGEG